MNVGRLFRIAIFSSPLMAVFGLTPVYILSDQPSNVFFIGSALLTVVCFLIWSQNILILMNTSTKPDWRRYLYSYIMLILLLVFLSFLRKFLGLSQLQKNDIFPFLNGIAMNTIVLVIMDSILSRERQNKVERELQEIKVQNIEAQQQLLMQQYQPHFLFNALSTLKSLMMESVDEAEEYLLKLSSFLRSSVQAHQHNIVSLEEELAFTQQYLEMQQIRFEGALECAIEIPPDILSKRLPVFALQSLIENAIKHNGFSAERPLELSIRTEGNKLIVSNNKLPKANIEASGTGLQSLNSRHQLLTQQPILIEETTDTFSVSLQLMTA